MCKFGKMPPEPDWYLIFKGNINISIKWNPFFTWALKKKKGGEKENTFFFLCALLVIEQIAFLITFLLPLYVWRTGRAKVNTK